MKERSKINKKKKKAATKKKTTKNTKNVPKKFVNKKTNANALKSVP